jgi:hypothetical protein
MIQFDIHDFNREANRLIEEMKVDARELSMELAMELIREIIEQTPVDTGRARGSWTVSFDRPEGWPSDREAEIKGQNSDTCIAEQIAKIKTFTGGTIYISSNCEYMEFLEDGSSSQSPSGIVRLSIDAAAQRMMSRGNQ